MHNRAAIFNDTNLLSVWNIGWMLRMRGYRTVSRYSQALTVKSETFEFVD